jgi:hypothetical protein
LDRPNRTRSTFERSLRSSSGTSPLTQSSRSRIEFLRHPGQFETDDAVVVVSPPARPVRGATAELPVSPRSPSSASRAGTVVKKTTQELGGSDPLIALPDADVGRDGALDRVGPDAQRRASCLATKRLLVHERIADKFIEEFAAALGGPTAGDPMDARTALPPLASRTGPDTLRAEWPRRSSMAPGRPRPASRRRPPERSCDRRSSPE